MTCFDAFFDDHWRCWVLAFPLFPRSLHNYLALVEPGVVAVRNIIGGVLNGTRYMHDEAFLIHTDIKPGNILLKCEGEEVHHVVLADLGAAVASSTGDRACRINAKGVRLQTWPYRAPEMYCGLAEFGLGVDVFPIGVLLYNLGGGSFGRSDCKTGMDVIRCYCKQLGSEGWEDYQGAQNWAPLETSYPRAAWPHSVRERLGQAAVELLDGLLQISACKRKTANECWEQPFVQHLRWPLLLHKGSPELPGDRHPWAARVAQVPHELEAFLFREEPLIRDNTHQWSFDHVHENAAIARHQQLELNKRKILENGYVGPAYGKPSSKAMCGFASELPSRLLHVRAFVRQLIRVNAAIFQRMKSEADAATSNLHRQTGNTKHFRRTPYDKLFCQSAQAHVVKDPTDGWVEPRQ